MLNLYARVLGALAFASLLLHAGMHVQEAFPTTIPALGWLAVAAFLVASVAASWAQARLKAKRAALWTALVLTGFAPMAAFALHAAGGTSVLATGYGVVLGLCLVFGLGASAFCVALLRGRVDAA